MRGVNKAIIIGNVGADPDVRQFNNGGSVATISVATSEKYQNKNTGEWVENTEWHRVEAFGKLAEIIAQYVKKGTSVYIEGKLKTDKYTDNQGVERYATNIIADQIQMLGGNNPQTQQQWQNQQPQPQPQQQQPQQFNNGQPVPPAYQNYPQHAPQNPQQQQPLMPQAGAVDDEVPF